jgi:hypothetical protein
MILVLLECMIASQNFFRPVRYETDNIFAVVGMTNGEGQYWAARLRRPDRVDV